MHKDITDRKQLEETQIIMNDKVDEAREKERQEIASEIHDELGQTIVHIKSKTNTLKAQLNKADDQEKCNEISILLGKVLDSVQKVSFNLWPEIIDHLGIAKAIEALTDSFMESSRLPIITNIDYSIQLPRDKARHVYRIAQESLTNIIRHASASSVTLKFIDSPNDILLQITDNGLGISPQAITDTNSVGLMGMKKRAGKLNANLSITNSKPQGTKIILIIPH